MRAALLSLVACLAPGPGHAATRLAAEAADGVLVERVEIAGNQYLQAETLLYYVATKPGDAYDERKLLEDFRLEHQADSTLGPDIRRPDTGPHSTCLREA